MDATRLESLDVLTPTGDQVSLGGLWRDRKVVLVLVRHFG